MSALHEFDLRLCDAVRLNAAQCLANKGFSQRLAKSLPGLHKFLGEERRPSRTGRLKLELLLNSHELEQLEILTSSVPGVDWQSLPVRNRESTQVTAEIRSRLAPAEARRWAEFCEGCIQRLDRQRLNISEGIEVVHNWVRELRRYMRALEEDEFLPQPEGGFPTPSHPSVSRRHQRRVDPIQVSVDRMREIIAKEPNGRTMPPDDLLRLAKIGRQAGREALRRLQQEGEYTGFHRDKPARYPSGKSGEHG